MAAFPVCRDRVFLAHAAVTTVPQCVADAMTRYTAICATSHQENDAVWEDVKTTRRLAADLLRCVPEEIALLGPTALGLSLFANGLEWQPGDEVVCYADDYPANVYPWLNLRRLGVKVTLLRPDEAGDITPELVASVLTDRTKLVALATANYFSGTRIDVDAIGHMLHERGVLFAIDGIQTLGAFPFDATNVDFLSADAHKWLLGPCAIGIVMVKREHFSRLRPTLLGAWNVFSPAFIAQEEIRFMPTAQRYEPGTPNFVGIYGLKAALELLLGLGIDRVANRLLELKRTLVSHLDSLGFEVIGVREGSRAHAITTCHRPGADHTAIHQHLAKAGIVCSVRENRSGQQFLRFSPHFYNTEAELDRAAAALRDAINS